MTGRTLAIMQPYFIPYAGYFRLFAASDLFVIYDCVQFPRRGWVHRNRLTGSSGALEWLTLPLAKAAQSTLINDLQFATGAGSAFSQRMLAFPLLRAQPNASPTMEILSDLSGSPIDYLERTMKYITTSLGLSWNVVRSSSLALPNDLRGQDRILEIARALGARRYINAPGGRALYVESAFADANIELNFLPEFHGSQTSILERILTEDKANIAAEILTSL